MLTSRTQEGLWTGRFAPPSVHSRHHQLIMALSPQALQQPGEEADDTRHTSKELTCFRPLVSFADCPYSRRAGGTARRLPTSLCHQEGRTA